MVVTLSHQYNVGERPTVILYTYYINRHTRPPNTTKTKDDTEHRRYFQHPESTEMSRLTRDGTAEPVSRDQILRHEREQANIHFPCSAEQLQDWQPYPVEPYSCYICVAIHIIKNVVIIYDIIIVKHSRSVRVLVL